MLITPGVTQSILPINYALDVSELAAHGGFTVQTAALGMLSTLMRSSRLAKSQLQAISHALCCNFSKWLNQQNITADCVSMWQDHSIVCCRLILMQLPGKYLYL